MTAYHGSGNPARNGAALLGTLLAGAMLIAACALVSDAGGRAASAGTRPASAPGPGTSVLGGWRMASSGTMDELLGVSCLTVVNCWSVGYRELGAATLNQVLHWTGRQWVPVPVPSPGGTGAGADSTLTAVHCVTATDCWAVGQYRLPGTALLDQVLHWTGRSWVVVPVPMPVRLLWADLDQLNDITCDSASSCWAVGSYGSEAGSGDSALLLNQVLHWTGRRWQSVPVPDPAGRTQNHVNALSAVRCLTPDDCWAGGEDGELSGRHTLVNEMLHWDGRSWKQVRVPDPGGGGRADVNLINGLACSSAEDCWAAGSYGRSGPAQKSLNQLLHWTGRAWHQVAAPEPVGTGNAQDQLNGVTCATPSDCWAVGLDGDYTGSRPGRSEVLHWDGAGWSMVTVPDVADAKPGSRSSLQAVSCAAVVSCRAVGINEPGNRHDTFNQLLHWDGTQWLIG